VTRDLTSRVKMRELVDHVAQQVGGKRGGRPALTQVGGINPAALPEASPSIRGLVRTAALTPCDPCHRRPVGTPARVGRERTTGTDTGVALSGENRPQRVNLLDDEVEEGRDTGGVAQVGAGE